MKITSPKYSWQGYCYGSISLCMIMKNEAKRLQRCLNSVRGLVEEIIIVDTGSTDNSIEIARKNGAIVLVDPWKDDFSIPRNLGIEKACGQWVLIMDPDEVILREDHIRIRELTCSKVFSAYQLTTYNYGRNPRELGYRTLRAGADPSGQFAGFVPSTKTRLWKNGLGIHFQGCWHELTDWYIINKKIPCAKVTVPIHHWSQEMTQNSVKDKVGFYLALGEKKVREWPGNGQAWWELAVAQSIAARRQPAIYSINQAIKRGFSSPNVFTTLARLWKFQGNKQKGDLAFEKNVCGIFTHLTHIDPSKKGLGGLIE